MVGLVLNKETLNFVLGLLILRLACKGDFIPPPVVPKPFWSARTRGFRATSHRAQAGGGCGAHTVVSPALGQHKQHWDPDGPTLVSSFPIPSPCPIL